MRALNAYVRAHRHTPFKWGVWDCLIFTNGAWRAMHGRGWADDWLGRYMAEGEPKHRHAIQREYGFKTLPDAIDSKLTRFDDVPPRGALVCRRTWRAPFGYALGIANGHTAIFTSETGLVQTDISDISGAWVETAV
jgi:hypothetical protein